MYSGTSARGVKQITGADPSPLGLVFCGGRHSWICAHAKPSAAVPIGGCAALRRHQFNKFLRW